jgi:hypothetical protein
LSDTFSPDFFNNAAAVFAILIFAKFVAHRARRARQQASAGQQASARPLQKRWDLPAQLHALCVVVASTGLILAMLVTEMQWTSAWLHAWIWIALAIAGLILLGDLIFE